MNIYTSIKHCLLINGIVKCYIKFLIIQSIYGSYRSISNVTIHFLTCFKSKKDIVVSSPISYIVIGTSRKSL